MPPTMKESKRRAAFVKGFRRSGRSGQGYSFRETLKVVTSTARCASWFILTTLFRFWDLNPLSLAFRRWRRYQTPKHPSITLAVRPRFRDLIKDWFLSYEGRKRKLLQWVHSVLPWLSDDVIDFGPSWQDGIILCGLMDTLIPESCLQVHQLKSHNRVNNCRQGIQMALNYLHIDQATLSPEEMSLAEDGTEAKLVQLLQLVKWHFLKQGGKAKVESQVTTEEPVPCKCEARGTGIKAGIVGKRTKFNIFVDSVKHLNLCIEVKGPNNGYIKETIVSMHPRGPSKYRNHVTTTNTDDETKSKVVEDSEGHRFLRQKSLDEGLSHLVIPFDYQCVGEGRFLATYIPRNAGIHVINILSGGNHINGSPFEVKVSDWVSSLNLVPKGRVVPFDMINNFVDATKEGNKTTDKIKCKLSSVASVSKQLTMMRRRILKKVITHGGKEILCDVKQQGQLPETYSPLDRAAETTTADPNSKREVPVGLPSLPENQDQTDIIKDSCGVERRNLVMSTNASYRDRFPSIYSVAGTQQYSSIQCNGGSLVPNSTPSSSTCHDVTPTCCDVTPMCCDVTSTRAALSPNLITSRGIKYDPNNCGSNVSNFANGKQNHNNESLPRLRTNSNDLLEEINKIEMNPTDRWKMTALKISMNELMGKSKSRDMASEIPENNIIKNKFNEPTPTTEQEDMITDLGKKSPGINDGRRISITITEHGNSIEHNVDVDDIIMNHSAQNGTTTKQEKASIYFNSDKNNEEGKNQQSSSDELNETFCINNIGKKYNNHDKALYYQNYQFKDISTTSSVLSNQKHVVKEDSSINYSSNYFANSNSKQMNEEENSMNDQHGNPHANVNLGDDARAIMMDNENDVLSLSSQNEVLNAFNTRQDISSEVNEKTTREHERCQLDHETTCQNATIPVVLESPNDEKINETDDDCSNIEIIENTVQKGENATCLTPIQFVGEDSKVEDRNAIKSFDRWSILRENYLSYLQDAKRNEKKNPAIVSKFSEASLVSSIHSEISLDNTKKLCRKCETTSIDECVCWIDSGNESNTQCDDTDRVDGYSIYSVDYDEVEVESDVTGNELDDSPILSKMKDRISCFTPGGEKEVNENNFVMTSSDKQTPCEDSNEVRDDKKFDPYSKPHSLISFHQECEKTGIDQNLNLGGHDYSDIRPRHQLGWKVLRKAQSFSHEDQSHIKNNFHSMKCKSFDCTGLHEHSVDQGKIITEFPRKETKGHIGYVYPNELSIYNMSDNLEGKDYPTMENDGVSIMRNNNMVKSIIYAGVESNASKWRSYSFPENVRRSREVMECEDENPTTMSHQKLQRFAPVKKAWNSFDDVCVVEDQMANNLSSSLQNLHQDDLPQFRQHEKGAEISVKLKLKSNDRIKTSGDNYNNVCDENISKEKDEEILEVVIENDNVPNYRNRDDDDNADDDDVDDDDDSVIPETPVSVESEWNVSAFVGSSPNAFDKEISVLNSHSHNQLKSLFEVTSVSKVSPLSVELSKSDNSDWSDDAIPQNRSNSKCQSRQKSYVRRDMSPLFTDLAKCNPETNSNQSTLSLFNSTNPSFSDVAASYAIPPSSTHFNLNDYLVPSQSIDNRPNNYCTSRIILGGFEGSDILTEDSSVSDSVSCDGQDDQNKKTPPIGNSSPSKGFEKSKIINNDSKGEPIKTIGISRRENGYSVGSRTKVKPIDVKRFKSNSTSNDNLFPFGANVNFNGTKYHVTQRNKCPNHNTGKGLYKNRNNHSQKSQLLMTTDNHDQPCRRYAQNKYPEFTNVDAFQKRRSTANSTPSNKRHEVVPIHHSNSIIEAKNNCDDSFEERTLTPTKFRKVPSYTSNNKIMKNDYSSSHQYVNEFYWDCQPLVDNDHCERMLTPTKYRKPAAKGGDHGLASNFGGGYYTLDNANDYDFPIHETSFKNHGEYGNSTSNVNNEIRHREMAGGRMPVFPLDDNIILDHSISTTHYNNFINGIKFTAGIPQCSNSNSCNNLDNSEISWRDGKCNDSSKIFNKLSSPRSAARPRLINDESRVKRTSHHRERHCNDTVGYEVMTGSGSCISNSKHSGSYLSHLSDGSGKNYKIAKRRIPVYHQS